MLKTQVLLEDKSYDLFYYPLTEFKNSTQMDEELVSKALAFISDKYLDDCNNILQWSSAVQENLGKDVISISCNNFRLQEIRVHNGKESQYLVSADFSLKFLSDKNCQAREIKDIIQLHGIRYSRGYRYWFLFEMSQNFLQLYMFPYYKYGDL